MAFPLVPVLLGAAVVGALVLTRKKSRFLGDKAQVGDEVIVPSSAFFQGQPPPGLPVGTTSVGVVVQDATDDNLRGPVVSVVTTAPWPGPAGGFQRNQLPTSLGPVMVPRSAVVTVLRNGKAVT